MNAAIIEVIVIIFLAVVAYFLKKDIKASRFFLNWSSFLITFGGTFVASILHFSAKEILNAFKFLKQIYIKKAISPDYMVNTVVELSNLFKDKGIEGIKVIRKDISHPILLAGLDLLSVDIEEEEFGKLLQLHITSYYESMKKYEQIFSAMGVYAPMLGLLGTVTGLIQLLRELSDPRSIAPNMAVALVTTFYGLILAGFVFLPISGKIRRRSEAELKNSQIIYDGFLMIKKRFGTFAIEQRLRAYL